MNRRSFLQAATTSAVTQIAGWTILSNLISAKAFAKNTDLTKWLKDLYQECHDLKAKSLTPRQWQDRMEALYKSVSLTEIVNLIDFQNLTKSLDYPSNMAAVKEVHFPWPPRKRSTAKT